MKPLLRWYLGVHLYPKPVTIPILNDLVVENGNFDTAVTLKLQTTRVTMRDNDSKLHCTQCSYIMLFESLVP